MSKSALILGLGVSGVAAARLLLAEGVAVTAVDAMDNEALRTMATALEAEGGRVVLGCDALPDAAADVCVTSPGVASDSAWMVALRERGVPVMSELALGADRCVCPILAVTGTNGKSTLVKLCAEALRCGGKRAAIAGNYGTPLCAVAGESADLDWIVAEVSSFQLEYPGTFTPAVGVLLNIQSDHLDRHGSMAAYRAIKLRLFSRMTAAHTALIPDTLADCFTAARCVTFGRTAGAGYRLDGHSVTGPGGLSVSLAGTPFDNPILGLAAAAAVGAGAACGVPAAAVESALGSLETLPHRMQVVARRDGITYIDDSKATNLAALQAALWMVEGPVRLIAGGQLKEKELDFVKEGLANKVLAVYVIGESANAMEMAWQDVVPCRGCGHLAEAVRIARQEARAGETVLLSPGTASFDQFRDYKDRGNQFTALVNQETPVIGGRVS